MSDSAPAPQDASSSEAIITDDSSRTPPPPPAASTSPRTAAALERTSQEALPGNDDDLFNIKPETVLELLSESIEALVRMTGDIPPTPPPSSPTVPHMRGMQAEKENIVRSHSEKNLALLAANAAASARGTPRGLIGSKLRASPQKGGQLASVVMPDGGPEAQFIDGVHLRKEVGPATPDTLPSTGSKATGAQAREPYIIHGANAQPLNTQHAAMSRKFYSKKPPPISITAYLARIHKFCPMSSAVYLSTALYIQRMAVTDRTIAVTDRNVHRLLLSGLRVANKALEDREWCWALSRMAKVGGVSETELTRYEIGFCFLTNFELVPSPEELKEQCHMLKSGPRRWAGLSNGVGMINLNMDPKPKRKREASGSSDNGG